MLGQNLIYIYDLPKKNFTSVSLAETIRGATGIQISVQPQIRRDYLRPFYSAIIKVESNETYKALLDGIRYFDFDGCPCRALPYDKELHGKARENLAEQSLFVRNIPKTVPKLQVHSNFHEIMSKYG